MSCVYSCRGVGGGGGGEKDEKSRCRANSLHRVISGRGKADNGRGREEEERGRQG